MGFPTIVALLTSGLEFLFDDDFSIVGNSTNAGSGSSGASSSLKFNKNKLVLIQLCLSRASRAKIHAFC